MCDLDRFCKIWSHFSLYKFVYFIIMTGESVHIALEEWRQTYCFLNTYPTIKLLKKQSGHYKIAMLSLLHSITKEGEGPLQSILDNSDDTIKNV